MKSVGLAGLVWGLLVAQASASSFDDFNYGIAASNRGDADAAIRYLSAAIAPGDLLSSQLAVAHFDRGIAYERKSAWSDAIADFSATIKLDSKFSEAYVHRASLYSREDQFDAAASDCATITVLTPRARGVQSGCGRVAWTAGRFEDAAAYFGHAVTLKANKELVYDALWLAMARTRAHVTSEILPADTVRELDLDEWPGPILGLFLGRRTPEDVALQAAQGDTTAQNNQICEMGFYVGEWRLARGETAEARALLQKASETCPKDFIERGPAIAEIKKLN